MHATSTAYEQKLPPTLDLLLSIKPSSRAHKTYRRSCVPLV